MQPSSPLDKYRSQLSFNPSDLIPLIHGSSEAASDFLKYQSSISNDPILRFDPSQLGEDRRTLYKMMCEKALRYEEKFDLHEDLKKNFGASYQFPEQIVTGLHHLMFIPQIANLGTEEQVKKWLPLARRYQILGCYAQTELGHGSDLQSLETVAVFQKDTDSFILNSPTLTSTKWWIGELGAFANYAIVQAQLIIDSKKYGVQSFIVQIRDLTTHKPLQGIMVGDIGPKFGYNAKDNGYLRFNNVPIPRDNLLAKYVQVDQTGKFKRTGNEKILYGTMMGVRSAIIQRSPINLARVLTIGVRYSLIRTQFRDELGNERTIFDYQLQQDKIIPLIADSYAMLFSGQKVKEIAERNIEKVAKGDFSMMPDLHAILSGCKAVYTWNTLFGMERVRQACGGHGYSQYSGIPGMISEFTPNVTYEGENTVMILQTARYLIKNLKKLDEGKKITPFLTYLTNYKTDVTERCAISNETDFHDQEIWRKILKYNAIFRILEARNKISQGLEEGLSAKDVWDKKAGNSLAEAAIAHINYFTFVASSEKVDGVKNEKLKVVLQRLEVLFAVNRVLEKPQALFESGYLTGAQFRLIGETKNSLLEKLKSDALGLVEAFLFSDNSLRSALGREDGKVYETLWDWMRNKNKLNQEGVHKALMKELRTGFKGAL